MFLSQISILVPTPVITISLSKFAYSFKFAGIKNLPCLSSSSSIAPDKKNLTKSLAFLLVSGKVFNLSSKFSHSCFEKPKRHPSNPLVMMNFSPISYLSFAGIISLLFASNECSYSPIIKFCHLLPVFTTLFHLTRF